MKQPVVRHKGQNLTEEYVAIGRAAKYLGVSVDTIRRWEKAGRFSSSRIDGKNRYFLMRDLEVFKNLRPLSTKAVAEMASISESSVRRLETLGQLIPTRDANGRRQYEALAVGEFLTQREKQGKQLFSTPVAEKAMEIARQTVSNQQAANNGPVALPAPKPAATKINVTAVADPVEDFSLEYEELDSLPVNAYQAGALLDEAVAAYFDEPADLTATELAAVVAPDLGSVETVNAWAQSLSGTRDYSSKVRRGIVWQRLSHKAKAIGIASLGLAIIGFGLHNLGGPSSRLAFANFSDIKASAAASNTPISDQALVMPSTFFLQLPNSGLVVDITNQTITGTAVGLTSPLSQTLSGAQLLSGTVTGQQIATGGISFDNLSPALQTLITSNSNNGLQTATTPQAVTNLYTTNLYQTTNTSTNVIAGLGLNGTTDSNGLTLGVNVGNSLEIDNNNLEVRLGGIATSTTNSASGLETTSAGLQLLGGCGVGQVIEYTGSLWSCGTVAAGSNGVDVKSGPTVVAPNTTSISFDSGAFGVVNSGGEADVSINYNNINAVGTITSGTWQGSTLAVQYGGTGATSFTSKGIVYGNGTGALQATAAGTAGQVLLAGTTGTPGFETISGDASLSVTGALALANTTVAGGTYGDGTHVPVFTVDAKGRLTNVASTLISGAAPTGAAGGDLGGTYPNPTIAKLQGTTLTTGSLAGGNLLIYNGTAWTNASLSGDITVNASGIATIGSGKVSNADLTNNSLTVTAGTGLSGGGVVALGGTASLSVAYGSLAGTAAQGNTSLSFIGSGNLTGSVAGTAGAGFTTNTLNVVASPSFTSVNLSTGSLQTAGTTRLTNAGALQNVTADNTNGDAFNANVLTTGTVADARLSTNVTLQGNTFNGANQLVQLSAAGKLPAIDGSQLTGVTATSYSGTLGVTNGGTSRATIATNGLIYGNGTAAVGVTAAGTAGQILQAGSGGTPIFNTVSGDASIGTTGVLTLGSSGVTASTYGDATHVAQVTVDAKGRVTSASSVIITGAAPTGSAGGDLTGNFPSPTLAKLQGNTLTLASVTGGQLLLYNGTAFVNQALSGDVTLSASGVATIANGAVGNAKLANSAVTVTAGSGLTGGGSVALGGATTLSLNYGDTASSVVKGNNTIVCSAGTGNLSGGGNTVILGDGGSCSSLAISNAPTFTTSVTTPSVISSGALSLTSSGAGNDVSINAGSGNINLLASNLSTTGSLSLDLNNSSNTVFTIQNTAGGSASLNLDSGGLQTAGVSRLTNAGGLQNVTASNANGVAFNGNTITSGTVADARLSTNVTLQGNTFNGASQLVQLTAAGKLPALDGSALTGITATGFSGTLGVANGGTGFTAATANGLVYGNGTSALGVTAAGTAGQVLLANASGLPTFTSISGDISFTSAGVATIGAAKVTNADLVNNSVTVTAGSNLIGGGSVALGSAVTLGLASSPTISGTLTLSSLSTGVLHSDSTGKLTSSAIVLGTDTSGAYVTSVSAANGGVSIGGTASAPTVAVTYGSTANSAVQGNTTLVCPAGSGNLSGGGNTVTLGTGGTCGALSTSASPTFATSVTTPSLLSSGALSLASTGAGNDLSISSGSGQVDLAANTLATTASLNLNLANASNTTFAIQNSGGGVANLNLSSGALQTAGTTRLTSAGALQNVTGDNVNGVALNGNTITAGTVADARLSTNVTLQGNTFNGASQLVKLDASGKLPAIDGSQLTGVTATSYSGTLSVANGGTGKTSLTANGLLYGNGTAAVGVTTAGTAGQLLLANASGVPTFISVSGDITFTSAGVATIGSGAVTGAKIAGGTITNSNLAAGSFGNITGVGTLGSLTVSGTTTLGGLSTAGVVHNSAAGVLSTSLVALGADTSGSYVSSIGSSTGLTVGGTASVPTFAVNYGSTANTAAQGNTALSFTGSGNLTGSVSGTAGGGLTTNTLATVNNPTFSTSVTTPSVTSAGALGLTSTGAGNDLSLTAGSGQVDLAASTVATTGSLSLNLANASATSFTLQNSGGGAANFNLSSGALQTAGTTRLSNTGVLQNVTGDNTNGVALNANTITSGTIANARLSTNVTLQGNTFNGASQLVQLTAAGKLPALDGSALTGITATSYSGTLGVANGGTGLTTATANGLVYGNGTGALGVTAAGTAGQVLLANAGGLPTFTSLTGDITVSSAGVTALGTGKVTNSNLASGAFGNITAVGTLTSLTDSGALVLSGLSTAGILHNDASGNITSSKIALGTDTTGSYVTSVGAGTNTTIGGTASAPTVNVVANPTFATSVTTPSVTATAGLSLSSGGTSDLSLSSASGNIALGATTLTTSNTSEALDLKGAGTNVFSLKNSGTGTASLNLVNGGLQLGGTTVLTSAGALQNVTGDNTNGVALNANTITSGTIANGRLSTSVTLQGNTFNGASQLVQLDASGKLPAIDGSQLTNIAATSYSGTLGVTHGGTGLNSLAANGILYASAANTVGQLTGSGSAVQLLLSNNGTPAFTTLTGDVTVNGTGVTALGAGKVTNTNLANGSFANITAVGTLTSLTDSGSLTLSSLSTAGILHNDASGNITSSKIALGTDTTGSYVTSVGAGTNTAIGGTASAPTVSVVANPTFSTSVTTPSIVATAGLSVASGGSSDLTLTSASGNIALGATSLTTSNTNESLDLKGAGTNIFNLKNSGTGTASLNLVNGGIQLNGTAVLTSAGALQNVTGTSANGVSFDGSVITGGTVATARLNTSGAGGVTIQGNTFNGNSQLVQLTSTGKLPALDGSALTNITASSFSGTYVASVGATNTSINVGGTASAPTLSVNYGTGANQAALGSNTITCPTVSGTNLGGGGGTITIGSGGSCNGITFATTPSFAGLTTTASITDNNAVALTDTTAPTASATSSQIQLGTNGAISGGSTNGTYLGVNQGSGGTADFLNFQVAGASKVQITSAGAVTANSFSGSGSGLTNLSASAVTTGTINNSLLTGSGALSVTAGTGLTGGGSVALGGSTSLAVAYGSTTGTAVQGSTTLVCPSGSGNLSGGGTTITLGTGGTCGALNTVANPTFTTSVTTPSVTATAGLTVSSGGTSDLGLSSASGNIALGATSLTTANTNESLDLKGAGTNVFNLKNSGTGTASLNLVNGGIQLNGTTVLTSAGALQNVTGTSANGVSFDGSVITGGTVATARLNTSGSTGVTIQGNTFNGISQLVQTDASGKLPAIDGSQLTNVKATTFTGTYVASVGATNTSINVGGTASAPTLSVNYGTGANQAALGSNTITCPTVSGTNLGGGGGTITIGTGGSCNGITFSSTPTFSGLTTGAITDNSAVALTDNLAPTASASAAQIQLGAGTFAGAAAGTYLGVNQTGTADFLNLETSGASKFQITSTGALTVAGTVTLSNLNSAGVVHTNASGQLSTSAISNSDLANNAISFSTSNTNLTVPGSAVALGGTANITLATNLTGLTGVALTSGSINVGSGGITNAGAISGATTITSSGAINGLTLGAAALTAAAALNVSSTGSNDLTLTSGSGNLVVAASNVKSTTGLTFTSNNASATTNTFTNSGGGLANLGATGSLSAGNGLSVTSGGATIAGTVILSGLNSAGIVHTNASGQLSTSAIANTDLSNSSISFSTGNSNLTVPGTAVSLGGTAAITLASNLTGLTGITFTSGGLNLASGGITNAGAISGATTIATSSTINGLTLGASALTAAAALNISSTGANDLTLTAGSGNLALGASNLKSSTGLTFTSNSASATTNSFTNSGGGLANLSTTGTITSGNGLTVSAGGASITGGLTAAGTVTLSGLNSAGIVHTNASGQLSTSTIANTDLSNSSLTVSAGTNLTGGGSVALGGTTTLALATNLTGLTGITFTSGNLNLASGGITNTGAISGLTTVADTAAPTASATSSLIQLGNGGAITSGAANGTYLSINQSTGNTADFLNFQVAGSSVVNVTSTGLVNAVGLNANNGGISNVGTLAGVSSLGLTGAITGATSITASGNINTSGGALQTAGTNRIDNSGNLLNIGTTNTTTAAALFTAGGANGFTFRPTTDNTGVFNIQSAGGSTTLFAVDSSGSNITIGGTSTTFATLLINNAHFESTQTTAPGAAVTTCATTATAVGTDAAGKVSFTSTSAGKCVITVTFAKPYAIAPKSVVIGPGSTLAYGTNQPYVSSISTTNFVITFNAVATTTTAYAYYYWVIE